MHSWTPAVLSLDGSSLCAFALSKDLSAKPIQFILQVEECVTVPFANKQSYLKGFNCNL